MEQEKIIKFNDCIEVIYDNEDEEIYNVSFSKRNGFCLYSEDEPLIHSLKIENSKLRKYYSEGKTVLGNNNIKEIKISDYSIRRGQVSIEGYLLYYDIDMANKYNLNKEEAIVDHKKLIRNKIIDRKIKENR